MSKRAGLIFDLVFLSIIMGGIFYAAFGTGPWEQGKEKPSGIVFVGDTYGFEAETRWAAAVAKSYDTRIALIHEMYQRQIQNLYPQEIRIVK